MLLRSFLKRNSLIRTINERFLVEFDLASLNTDNIMSLIFSAVTVVLAQETPGNSEATTWRPATPADRGRTGSRRATEQQLHKGHPISAARRQNPVGSRRSASSPPPAAALFRLRGRRIR